MIKGGFQGLDISGVDLTAQSPTLPGAYAACAGAEGKTVLILTAAGAVQCSVKKVSTNYVLAGITGDGKILSITIGSTDGISVSEVEIPSGGGGGEETDVYLDSAVNLNSTTSSSPYTAEYDGIVKLSYNGSSSLAGSVRVSAFVGSAQTDSEEIVRLLSGAGASALMTCFVKKGTKMYYTGSVTGVSAQFFPYKPVQS